MGASMDQTDFLLKELAFQQVPVLAIDLYKANTKAYPVLLGIDREAKTYYLRFGVERAFETIESKEKQSFLDEITELYGPLDVTYYSRFRSSFLEVTADLPTDPAVFEQNIRGLMTDISEKCEELKLMETDFMGELVEETIAVYRYDQTYYLLNRVSAQRLNKEASKYPPTDATTGKKAILTGLIGALLGIFLGFIFVFMRWGIVLHLRVHLWLPTLLASLLGFYFYRKRKGPVDKASYLKLAASVWGLSLVYNYLYYAFGLGSGRYFFNFLSRLPELLKAHNFMGEFMLRTGISLVVVSLYACLHYLFHRRFKRLSDIDKIE